MAFAALLHAVLALALPACAQGGPIGRDELRFALIAFSSAPFADAEAFSAQAPYRNLISVSSAAAVGEVDVVITLQAAKDSWKVQARFPGVKKPVYSAGPDALAVLGRLLHHAFSPGTPLYRKALLRRPSGP